MSDRIRIISGLLGDFSTAPWGCLKVEGGKVTLDNVKAFNRARRMLNSGANQFRILRRNQWSADFPFDWQDEGYWPMLREFVQILHQPYQEPAGAGQGADVWIEIFDNCSDDKDWMYDPHQWPKAEALIRAMFENLGDLPYVKFGTGNELNSPDARAFVRESVFPEFKKAGRVPFSFGAVYQRTNPPGSPGPLEWQKYEAEKRWDEQTALSIYRPVHGVRDSSSMNLIDTVKFWVEQGNPICVLWSMDGVWDGLSECDYTTAANGIVQRRPSVEQIKAAMKYWIDIAWKFAMTNGQVKYGFEHIAKAQNNDLCSALSIRAISESYQERFAELPENFGKYPLDWVEPIPPDPPDPPVPPVPKSCYEKYIKDRPIRKWQVGRYILCKLRIR
jgi:hypothetical protein